MFFVKFMPNFCDFVGLFIVIVMVRHIWFGGHRGRDRMVVGFTTTYAISAYHH